MKDIQAWLGHSNYSFTANTYGHSSKESHLQMAQSLSEKPAELAPAFLEKDLVYPLIDEENYG